MIYSLWNFSFQEMILRYFYQLNLFSQCFSWSMLVCSDLNWLENSNCWLNFYRLKLHSFFSSPSIFSWIWLISDFISLKFISLLLLLTVEYSRLCSITGLDLKSFKLLSELSSKLILWDSNCLFVGVFVDDGDELSDLISSKSALSAELLVLLLFILLTSKFVLMVDISFEHVEFLLSFVSLFVNMSSLLKELELNF
jgi:hypothetical protein